MLVIGGGQAGLAVAHRLVQRGARCLVLDASARIGDAWRTRWDSLRLFTPARYSALDGLPFPAPAASWPSKDEMADYLEQYATHFALPVRSGVRVDRLGRDGDGFVAHSGDARFHGRTVVVAMSDFQAPRRPAFAAALAPHIRQLDAGSYRNPRQLPPGPVLVVGAGNSGAEIAKDLAASRPVLLAGRAVAEIPLGITHPLNRHLLVHLLNGVVFPHLLSLRTPLGRRLHAAGASAPLIRVKARELDRLGVRRVGRVIDARDGRPVLEDGTQPDPASVIWCTGFDPRFGWVDLPALDPDGSPLHERGAVRAVPGLYFVGLHFLSSFSSAMVHGVSADARRIADAAIAQAAPAQAAPAPASTYAG
ncbi:hypothetical protein GY24_16350 [Microterricola pindariensis]|uniref:Portal protein n=1 Tax=Microterricola pindariensis TaxID=478010 RepID=A0ABX5AQU3_9MICO|nr:hypothetical protein GY24_16350 [Microterricola pindariensis]